MKSPIAEKNLRILVVNRSIHGDFQNILASEDAAEKGGPRCVTAVLTVLFAAPAFARVDALL